MRSVVLLATLALATVCVAEDESFGHQVLKHSFQPPYHPESGLPFWQVEYGAKLNPEYIRVTPARQSRVGAAWNTAPSTLTDWEVVMKFHVTGQPALGGDGFAFWYVDKPNMIGPVYGGMDYWDGLGVFFDTFNNDGVGDFPSITAIVNDGHLKFDSGTDGSSQSLAHCSAQFRNRDSPSSVRIKYQGNTLVVSYDLEGTGNTWTDCFTINNVELGVDKYFGITAGTGDLADNHDVYSLVTKNLSPIGVDVEAVRKRFREKQHTHAMMRAESSTQPMDPTVFQNTVLSLLNQIQSTANLIEMAQIATANLISSQQKSSSTASSGGGGGGASTNSAELENALAAMRTSQTDLKTILNNMRVGNDNLPSIQGVTTLLGKMGPAAFDQNNNPVKQQLDEVLNILRGTHTAASSGSSGGGGGMVGSIVMLLLGFGLGCGGMWYIKRSKSNAYKLP